eukprot:3850964-Rhodomonas_salina.1
MAAGMGAAGGMTEGGGLDSSFESRFENFSEGDEALPELIDTNFLIKELWDPDMRADFACGRFSDQSMTTCQAEIGNVLRRKGVPILFPFPVPEKSRLPGVWISFELFREHPAANEESWITNRCSSPVWHFGLQGWYILTGLIKSRKVTVTYNARWFCYEMNATEQSKRMCLNRQEENFSQPS